MHGISPLVEKKSCRLCFQYQSTVTPEKLYNRKGIFMMETLISYFHTSFYIDTCSKALKRRSAKQYVLFCRDYYERVVASFAHQIKSEYYGRDISVSIEVIALENFSEPIHK